MQFAVMKRGRCMSGNGSMAPNPVSRSMPTAHPVILIADLAACITKGHSTAGAFGVTKEQGGARWYVASRMQSAKAMPGHLKMKVRQTGQSAPEDVNKRDLRAELEAREREHFNKGIDFEEERKKDLELLEAPATADTRSGGKALIPKAADADEEEEGAISSDDSDDDDEDEEAALLAELERIKKERAEEARKKAAEEEARQAKEKEKELMTGNPLLGLAGSDVNFNLKRRWDEDVVFKNQSRNEPKAQKRFINDTIRNDFHKRFLQRYIR